jgi:NitT/TauT family transport system ATP-binding protein
MTDYILQVKDFEKTFRSRQGVNRAIDGLSFDLRRGEFLVMVGPSGCGKTTLLRSVAGLLDVDSGERIVATGTRRGLPNSLSIVFQEYSRSLFPWLTVERNVAFGLDDVPRRERTDRVAEALNLVGLEQFGRHYPWQLSGGMQQRVAIARAVARRSALLLMDEPFASIDAQMRASLENMIARLWAQLGFSVVFVTHDIDEAILLADRVLVLSDRPSHVLRELVIDLPRPRDQVNTKADPKFGAFRAEIFKLLSPAEETPKPAVIHS